jgi:hypothetical protein
MNSPRHAGPTGDTPDAQLAVMATPELESIVISNLRAAIAEAERQIDRLMIIRRRQLAAARSRQRGKPGGG